MIRLNLLKEEKDLSSVYFLQGFAAVSLLFFLLISCFLYHDTISSEYETKVQNEASLKVALEELKKKTSSVEDLKDKEKLLEQKINAINLVKAKKQIPVQMLDLFTQTVPERVWLESLKDNGAVIDVKGYSIDNQTVSNFILALEQSPYLKDIKLSFTGEKTYRDAKVMEFSFAAIVGDAISAQKEMFKKRSKEAASGVIGSGALGGLTPVIN